MSIEDKVKEYILENYLFTDDMSALGNDDSFIEKGIIDSTGILEVIFFLEETFGLAVEDDEMVPENFDSVNNIATFVNKKTAA